jgi:hypothetical protein
VLAVAGSGLVTALAGCTGGISGQPTQSVAEDPPVSTTERAFGEPYRTETLEMVVADPQTAQTQTWTKGGETRTAEAPDGRQWLFVTATARNRGSEPETLPLTMYFRTQVGDRLYQAGRTRSFERKYVGGEVDPGVEHEGAIGYLLPETHDPADVGVLYAQKRQDEHYRVRWS